MDIAHSFSPLTHLCIHHVMWYHCM